MHSLLDLELARAADHDRAATTLSPLRPTLVRLLGLVTR